jgi:hypothetical protein
MRAAPVHAAAFCAPGEFLVRPPCARQQLRGDFLLWRPAKFAVADDAPRPRLQDRREPVNHIGQLFVSALAADVRPEPEPSAPEQPAVLCQQHPPTGVSEFDEGVIVEVVGVRGVQADEPHPARQGAEVHIQQEPRLRQRLRPADRRDANPITGIRLVRRLHRRSVHKNRSDLRQRDTSRLDDVPDRGCAIGSEAGYPTATGLC